MPDFAQRESARPECTEPGTSVEYTVSVREGRHVALSALIGTDGVVTRFEGSGIVEMAHQFTKPPTA
ncbi:hypothetical protein ACQYWQ_20050 [Streptomyces sp. P6-2-1]|uniref:hypothetical protein n=1 Tax=unclassified Streptomyces TaxID=2593676 RepID=UPI003D368D40